MQTHITKYKNKYKNLILKKSKIIHIKILSQTKYADGLCLHDADNIVQSLYDKILEADYSFYCD